MTELQTAAAIIEEGNEQEETPSIEDEFRDLQEHVQGVVDRLQKVATTLEQHSTAAATKGDVAKVYRFLAGDVISSLADLVAASGAAFNDVFEILENDGGDGEDGEGEGEGEDNTPSDEDVQVYTTLKMNVTAYQNLASMPGMSEDQQKAFEQMVTINQDCMAVFHESYGEEAMKEAAGKKIAEASGA